MNGLFRVNAMNLNALRDDLHRENESGETLAILSETEKDVLTSDFDARKAHTPSINTFWEGLAFLLIPSSCVMAPV